ARERQASAFVERTGVTADEADRLVAEARAAAARAARAGATPEERARAANFLTEALRVQANVANQAALAAQRLSVAQDATSTPEQVAKITRDTIAIRGETAALLANAKAAQQLVDINNRRPFLIQTGNERLRAAQQRETGVGGAATLDTA